jgi:hypothetical protein
MRAGTIAGAIAVVISLVSAGYGAAPASAATTCTWGGKSDGQRRGLGKRAIPDQCAVRRLRDPQGFMRGSFSSVIELFG